AHADLLRVDDGVGDARLLAIPVEADAPQAARRQPLGDLLERLAAVGGAVQAAAGAPLLGRVADVVDVALPLPGGDQQRLGVGRVHPQVDDAGLVIDVEDALPRLAAVGRLVQAALLAGAVQPAQGADVDDVRAGRVDED